MFTAILSHEINESPLAVKQALSYGCGLLTTGCGHLSEILMEGKNGYAVSDERTFVRGWNLKDRLLQLDCYNSVKKYSKEEMVKSFLNAAERALRKN